MTKTDTFCDHCGRKKERPNEFQKPQVSGLGAGTLTADLCNKCAEVFINDVLSFLGQQFHSNPEGLDGDTDCEAVANEIPVEEFNGEEAPDYYSNFEMDDIPSDITSDGV